MYRLPLWDILLWWLHPLRLWWHSREISLRCVVRSVTLDTVSVNSAMIVRILLELLWLLAVRRLLLYRLRHGRGLRLRWRCLLSVTLAVIRRRRWGACGGHRRIILSLIRRRITRSSLRHIILHRRDVGLLMRSRGLGRLVHARVVISICQFVDRDPTAGVKCDTYLVRASSPLNRLSGDRHRILTTLVSRSLHAIHLRYRSCDSTRERRSAITITTALGILRLVPWLLWLVRLGLY